jgi:flagellar hook protein FlgE
MNSRQCTLTYTSSPTDLAVEGQGFFVVSDANGTMSLTRAGSFAKNGNGDLVNAAGFKLMAYPVTGGTNPVTNGFAGLVPVSIASLGPVAQPSTFGTLSVNLPPESAVVTGSLPSSNAPGAVHTKMTSLVVYDNVGTAKTLDIYETKTATNTWEIAVFDRSAATIGGFPYTGGPLA